MGMEWLLQYDGWVRDGEEGLRKSILPQDERAHWYWVLCLSLVKPSGRNIDKDLLSPENIYLCEMATLPPLLYRQTQPDRSSIV